MESDRMPADDDPGSPDGGQRQPPVSFRRTPEFVEKFSRLLSSVEESSQFLADDPPPGTYDLFETFSRSLAEFQAYVNSFGPKEDNPFLVFLHTCIHEINNPLQALMLMCDQSEGFDLSAYELNRQKILEGVQLLRSGEPPKANFNLKNLAEELAASHDMRVLCTESYDASSEVRLSPVTLKWILDNLKRGADTVNGHPANVALVLDSDPGVDGAPPQLRVYFVSDCEDTPLTPFRFYNLIENPPKNGQHGGRGIHYTNSLLSLAQQPSHVGDGEPCLRFRKKDTHRPLLSRDRDILTLAGSSSSFLFEINLSGVRVLAEDEKFDQAFDQALYEVAANDPCLQSLFDSIRGNVRQVMLEDTGTLKELLRQMPREDRAMRRGLQRLVGTIRQRLAGVEVAA